MLCKLFPGKLTPTSMRVKEVIVVPFKDKGRYAYLIEGNRWEAKVVLICNEKEYVGEAFGPDNVVAIRMAASRAGSEAVKDLLTGMRIEIPAEL